MYKLNNWYSESLTVFPVCREIKANRSLSHMYVCVICTFKQIPFGVAMDLVHTMPFGPFTRKRKLQSLVVTLFWKNIQDRQNPSELPFITNGPEMSTST